MVEHDGYKNTFRDFMVVSTALDYYIKYLQEKYKAQNDKVSEVIERANYVQKIFKQMIEERAEKEKESGSK